MTAFDQSKWIEIKAVGLAQPQGSKSARVVKGRAIMTEGFGDGPRRRKAWREAVADSARAWVTEHPEHQPYDGPIAVDILFLLPRPATAPKRVQYPMRKPDLSKLIRSVEDSMSKILYTDDARIVRLVAQKQFTAGVPRVHIVIRPITEATLQAVPS